MKSYKQLFITGYDANAEWLLKWFIENYTKHHALSEIMFYNFDQFRPDLQGWFKKPAAMLDAAKYADKVCWIDIDCEVRGNLSGIFDYIEPNKLAMAEDVPWTKRFGEKWHNSGVVAFERVPPILRKWNDAILNTNARGDQEVLHELVRHGMARLMNITDLPRMYNTLRLDLVNKTAPKEIKVMHWTGAKGKQHIREIING